MAWAPKRDQRIPDCLRRCWTTCLHGGFDGAAADGIACLTEQVIAHTPAIVVEIENGVTHVIR